MYHDWTPLVLGLLISSTVWFLVGLGSGGLGECPGIWFLLALAGVSIFADTRTTMYLLCALLVLQMAVGGVFLVDIWPPPVWPLRRRPARGGGVKPKPKRTRRPPGPDRTEGPGRHGPGNGPRS